MANIAGELTNRILGHSDADKAFRPWWDNLEDAVLYSFVVMGAVTLPMTFITNTPIECTIHPDLWFSDTFTLKNNSIVSSSEFSMAPTASTGKASVRRLAMYLRNYSKKYCTETSVSPFLLYYSFCLFLVPLILIFIEKTFISVYGAESRQDILYSILKDSLKTEDVAKMENDAAKNSHEVYQALRNSRGLHDSYLYRTAMELIAAGILMIFFARFGEIDGISTAMFSCYVHEVPFNCVIPNHRFFMVIYMMAVLMLLCYFLLTTYNLLWLVHPKVPRLERILSGCKREDEKSRKFRAIHHLVKPHMTSDPVKHPKQTNLLSRQKSQLKLMGLPEEAPEVRLDMYFDKETKDFRLMMNLLSERPGTAGLAQSFRILTIFDKHFKRLWIPNDVRILDEDISSPSQNRGKPEENGTNLSQYSLTDFKEDEYEDTIWIAWNDCNMADYIAKKLPKCIIEYTVEISPADHVETPVKSVMYHTIPDFYLANQILQKGKPFNGLVNAASFELDNKFKYKTRFDAADIQGKDINISIATELDGKTVAQLSFKERIKNKETKKEEKKEDDTDHESSTSKTNSDKGGDNSKTNKNVSFDSHIRRKTSLLHNSLKTHNLPVVQGDVKMRKYSHGAHVPKLCEEDSKKEEKYEILNERETKKSNNNNVLIYKRFSR